jgi:iron-sulfur cluster repair protein YtfE (RIC family)
MHVSRGRSALAVAAEEADGVCGTDQLEVNEMNAITESREAVRTFVDHEHQELRSAVEWVHEVTEGMSSMPVDQRSESLRRVLHWVDVDLKPHMAWEESWLFPNIDDGAMPHWATGLVRFDHRQIAAQAERLRAHRAFGGPIPSGDVSRLVADLAGFEALMRAHIEREERFVMPLLEPEGDRWTAEWRD